MIAVTRIPGRRRRHSHWEHIRSDAVTGGLAVGTVVIAGLVGIGQFTRRLNRRVQSPETHGLLDSAPAAAIDTLGVARESITAATDRESILFNLLAGFLGSFATVRFTTWAIREGRGPFRNVRVGGRHIHHFVPGILTGFGAGVTALLVRGRRTTRGSALGLGIGAGLTFDEAALLLDMRDVYWSREGLLSVQISLATGATLGLALLTMRLFDRAERRQEEAGLIPGAGAAASETMRYARPGTPPSGPG